MEDANKQWAGTEALKDALEAQTGAQAVFDGLFDRHNGALQAVFEMQKRLEEALAPFQESIKRIQEACDLAIAPALKAADLVVQIQKRRQLEKQTLLKTGWWLPPTIMDMPAFVIDRAFDAYQSGNPRAVTQMFVSVFGMNDFEHLRGMVTGWQKNRFFHRWRKAIDQALSAHMDKKYHLSVPALLIAAEGIAKDYCVFKNVYNKSMRSRPKDKIRAAMRAAQEIKDDGLLADCLISALENRIYGDTDRVKKSARGFSHFLNRHAVLHGLSSTYGTKKNSLQCFMLLDVLNVLK